MKKILLIGATILTMGISSSFANECVSISNYESKSGILTIPNVTVDGATNPIYDATLAGSTVDDVLTFRLTAASENELCIRTINTNNPMDWVGIAHNNGLNFVLNNLPKVPENVITAIEPITSDSSKAVVDDSNMGEIQRLTQLYFNVPSVDVSGMGKTLLELVTDLTERGILTRTEKLLFVELDELLAANKNSLVDTTNAILALEERVLLKFPFPPVFSPTLPNPRHTADGIRLFYISTSIARHSAKFWAPVDLGGANNGATSRTKWWQILLGDIAGGLIGGVPGAVAVSAAVGK